jgi:peptidoglycan hydrolase-like protein with peptidoglycan-binding domain
MPIRINTKFEQVFYNLYGYSKAVWGYNIAEDNVDGPQTQKVRKSFQKIQKIVDDGKTGPQTQKQIKKVIQEDLNRKGISKLALGVNLAVDGVDGPVTDKVILKLQSLKGLKQDKILGIVTLTALAYYNSTGTNISTTGWARIIYTRDSQDKNYTCGPSSLKMALSVYGYNYSESTLEGLLGSQANIGTSNESIVSVVNTLGKGLKAWNESFKSWETLRGYLVKGWPVILRVSSWLTPGGEHYVVLVGLNIESGQVELGDPSHSGFRSTTISDLRERIRKVNVPSVIVISK